MSEKRNNNHYSQWVSFGRAESGANQMRRRSAAAQPSPKSSKFTLKYIVDWVPSKNIFEKYASYEYFGKKLQILDFYSK